MARKKLKNAHMKKEAMTIKSYISSQKRAGALNLNHPLQRESQQWSNEEKSNFIRRLCWHEPVSNPYIVEYEDENDRIIRYLIDGKQRFTTILSFVNNEFAISKKARNTEITYEKTMYETEIIQKNKKEIQQYRLDENGCKTPVRNEEGIIQSTIEVFDIAGKRFKQFPEELREKFLDYTFDVDIRLNGTNEDIQNDILDFNSGKPMNAAQIGVNLLGTNWATQINQLTKHDFISDNCGFTVKDINKDVVHASINETLMLINFASEWRSNAKEIGSYLGGHLEQYQIDELEEMMSELNNSEMPDDDDIFKDNLKSKEFFIIMANYHHFKQTYGNDTDIYVKFLDAWFRKLMYQNSTEFTDTNVLRSKEEEPISYAEFSDEKRSKSINIVTAKLNYMNEVMEKWLDTEIDTDESNDSKQDDISDKPEDEEELYDISDRDAVIIAALNYPLPKGFIDNGLIYEVKKDLAVMPEDDVADYLADCEFYGGEAKKLLSEFVDVEHSDFDSCMNAAALACVIREFREEYKTDYERVILPIIEAWISDFSAKWEDDDFHTYHDNEILSKERYMKESIIEFNKTIEEEE